MRRLAVAALGGPRPCENLRLPGPLAWGRHRRGHREIHGGCERPERVSAARCSFLCGRCSPLAHISTQDALGLGLPAAASVKGVPRSG